ncbi:MAG: phytoene desaturase [Phycisphaerae bacterium]|nr:phytoene desaturase [Phycisphaerae bacterium]
MTPHAPSICVVGAGPGGLASAVLLAASGARVTIYERQPHIGGRTGRVTLDTPLGPFHFDRGPTFFLMPFVLEEILAAAGRRLTDAAHLTRLDPMYRLSVGDPAPTNPGPDTVIDCTQDPRGMRDQLDALAPGDGDAFEAFIRENRAKLAAFTPILRRPFTGPLDALRPDMLRALPSLHPFESVADQLARRFRHRVSRLALSFQSKYLGMSPSDCPSLFTILPFIEHEFGVWHPRGGCHALMLALADTARALGVRIETGRPIPAVEFEGSRAVGVRLDGPSGPVARHDHVVLNADAAHALRTLVPEALRPPTLSDSTLEAKRYSCSTFMLYLALRGRLDLPHHTIRISSRYEQNLDDITRGRLSDDPSLYVCNPAATDPTLAPHGCSALYVLVPTPNLKAGDPGWSNGSARALRERALDRVSALVGRDVRSLIIGERSLSPLDWEADGIQFGATFNLAHNLGQMLHLRPQHRVPGLDGLWLVGGGTHPGSGLPVIFLSAQITSRLLAQEAGLKSVAA